MDSVALERIAFQIKSQLATKVISACQSAMDELKESRGSNTVLANRARIARATEILEKTFVPEMIKICKEELNLHLEVEIFQNVVLLNASTYTEYKAYRQGDSWKTIVFGYNIFSGTQVYDPNSYDLDYFKTYAENVDLEKSKLKTYTTEHTTYLFLFTTTFMTEEIISSNLISPITAEEMAAVILHELGHAETILEHMADVYNRTELATNTVKYLNEKADDKVLTTAVTSIESQSKVDNDNLEKATSMLSKIKGKISNVAPVVAILWGSFIILYILGAIAERLQLAGRFGKINSTYNKTSDTVVTESNESYMERIADEFVARHGLGTSLVSALEKIHKYYEQGHQYNTFSEAVKALGLIQASILSFSIISDFLSPLLFGIGDGTYDPDWLRFEHILANTMVVFKDDSLDPKVRDHFLKETKKLIDLIDKYKNRKNFKFKQLFWGTIFKILSRTSLVDSFSTAGLSADYDSLQLLTNGLIKNRLLYQAARLKNL